LDDNLPCISADPQQLEQVLVNLFLNAIDAMSDGGQLTVKAALKLVSGNAPFVIITVKDDGHGIEPSDLPMIFQPFFSAKKGKGMGLGLPISDRIIKNHGGTIEVESEIGKGTTFRIHLPQNQRPAESNGTDSTTAIEAETATDINNAKIKNL